MSTAANTTMSKAEVEKTVKDAVAKALKTEREERASKAAEAAGKKVRENVVLAAEKAKYGAGIVAGAAAVGAGLCYVVVKGTFRGMFR